MHPKVVSPVNEKARRHDYEAPVAAGRMTGGATEPLLLRRLRFSGWRKSSSVLYLSSRLLNSGLMLRGVLSYGNKSAIGSDH